MALTADSAEAVQRMFDRSLCRMHYDLGTDRAPWSVASFGGVQMAGIDLYRDEAIGGRRARRSQADIAQNPCEDFLLAMPFDARIDLRQNGAVRRCEPGMAILFSTAQPFDSIIEARRAGDRYTQYLSKLSAAKLRLRLSQIDVLDPICFDVDRGAGRIVKSLFDLALDEMAGLHSSQQQGLGGMLVDAVANAVLGASTPIQSVAAAPLTSPQRLRRRALIYIERCLGDASLDVSSVARHCGVSERYLHGAFAAEPFKLGALIRERRLQNCRRDLRSPANQTCSVTEIAFRWGFEDAAHFSHAYKARFGCSPRQERWKPGIEAGD